MSLLGSHNLTQAKRILEWISHSRLLRFFMRLRYKRRYANTAQTIFDICFDSPFGLACGYDENGNLYDTLSDLGASFVEIGPITLREKDGQGVEEAVALLRKKKPRTRLLARITKNEFTIEQNAYQDFSRSMALLYDFVDAFVIDSLSGGVTQDVEDLSEIIEKLLETRRYFDVKRPIFINISQGVSRSEIDGILSYAMRMGLDGIVVRDCPLVEYIYKKTSGNLIIIAAGDGIGTPEMAYRMLCDGATLVEFDDAFLREGPTIFKKANQLLHFLRK